MLAPFASFALATPTAPPPPSAIVMHVVDDLGWNDLSYQNNALPSQSNAMRSPHIDALAHSGVRLFDYSVFKFCSPSRTQFLTGRYAYHLGQQTPRNLGHLSEPCGVPLGVEMLPAMLRRGPTPWTSRAYGKWHQGMFNASYTPVGRGFESFFGFYDGGESYYTHVTPYSVWREEGVPYWWTPMDNTTYPAAHSKDRCGALVDFANDSRVDGEVVTRPADLALNGSHSTPLLAAAVVRDIEAHDASTDGSLFLYVAWHAVHAPLEVSAAYTARFEATIDDPDRRTLAGMVAQLDDAIANVTAAMKRKGLWEDAVVIFTTDNGGPVCLNMSASTQRGEMCTRDCGTNNAPLRGSKMTLWQGGVRAVGFISGGRVPTARRGAQWAGMAHGTDWYATIANLAGLTPTALVRTGDVAVDGLDLWGAIMGDQPSPRNESVLNIDERSATANRVGAIRVGKWKLITGYPGCFTGSVHDPASLSPMCYNGYDGRWQAPETTQPAFDRGVHAPHPAPCTSNGGCLFDLDVDPLEAHDLAGEAEHAATMAMVLARYAALAKSEVTLEEARLCPIKATPENNGCRANLEKMVWQPWL